jgi:3-hydroxyacyl-[acyl-carrier-protein] dehydratase
MSSYKHLLKKLPYSEPFLFVDDILEVTDNGIKGAYTYRPDAFFYRGHFKDHPVTPGVILTETMAQIGLVCYGLWLFDKDHSDVSGTVALSHTSIDFLKAVLPGERVEVISTQEYFRFGKLKCKVKMIDQSQEVVCRGTISGMLIERI